MEVGDVLGTYTVLRKESRLRGGKKRLFLDIICSECCKDEELYGDGIFEVALENNTIKRKPCGCGVNHKRSKAQWEVLLRRKAECEGKKFIGFSGEFKGNTTKITLYCKVHGKEYSTCSIANFIRDRDCPDCANESRALHKLKTEEEFTEAYLETGAFHEGTTFKRLDKRDRLVYCPVCDESFVADNSNLIVGKNPCKCREKNRSPYMERYFYIIEAVGEKKFVGFGITFFPKRRVGEHKKNLKEFKSEVKSFRIYKSCGKHSARELETYLKSLKMNYRTGVGSFTLEAMTPEKVRFIENVVDVYGFKKVE